MLDNNIKHAGIVEIPTDFDDEAAIFRSHIQANLLKFFVDELGKKRLEESGFYIAHDGHRVIDEKGEDILLYSQELIERDYGLSEY